MNYLSPNKVHTLAVVRGVEVISRRNLDGQAVGMIGLRATITALGSLFCYRVLEKYTFNAFKLKVKLEEVLLFKLQERFPIRISMRWKPYLRITVRYFTDFPDETEQVVKPRKQN